MSKKTNKHRPAKRVRPPTTRIAPPAEGKKPASHLLLKAEVCDVWRSVRATAPPAASSAGTKIVFYDNTDGRHFWKATRGGNIVAESTLEGFSSRDKAARSFRRLAESLARGDWKITGAVVE